MDVSGITLHCYCLTSSGAPDACTRQCSAIEMILRVTAITRNIFLIAHWRQRLLKTLPLNQCSCSWSTTSQSSYSAAVAAAVACTSAACEVTDYGLNAGEPHIGLTITCIHDPNRSLVGRSGDLDVRKSASSDGNTPRVDNNGSNPAECNSAAEALQRQSIKSHFGFHTRGDVWVLSMISLAACSRRAQSLAHTASTSSLPVHSTYERSEGESYSHNSVLLAEAN